MNDVGSPTLMSNVTSRSFSTSFDGVNPIHPAAHWQEKPVGVHL